MTTVYVPRDSAARSVGADEVAAALRGCPARPDLRLVRNGSRGMLWLEPLVEVDVDGTRVAYGPVGADDVAGLLDAGLVTGATTRCGSARSTTSTGCAGQDRVTFARVGVVDPRSGPTTSSGTAVWPACAGAGDGAADVVEEVTRSGLRGRGRRGLPGRHQVADRARCPRRARSTSCCNADEGDSGTFADRMLMEGDPVHPPRGHGDRRLRRRRPPRLRLHPLGVPRRASTSMQHAVDCRASRRLAGRRHPRLRVGVRPSRSGSAPGAYICGEETSMLESLEGNRGEVRAKPPLPALEGLFGKPTVVNNVLTLATVPTVLADGAAAYADAWRRPQPRHAGVPAGRQRPPWRHRRDRLRDHARRAGRGLRRRHRHRAAGAGGPGRWSARRLPPVDQFDLPIDYEAFAAVGAMLGHGGVVVFDDTVDMAAQARFAMEFCADRVLRQVHAVPDRLDARRRGDRSHRRGDDREREPRVAPGPVRGAWPTVRCARWAD